MRVDNAFVVKRQQDSDDEALSASIPKRPKLENNSSDDESLSLPRKPATQGVEQIPYPSECRPTGISYDWYRRQLIIKVKERLAVQSRRVTSVRFLDDAVAFDWLFDKSTFCGLHSKGSDDDDQMWAVSEGLQPQPTKVDSTSKVEDKEIPGLHIFNSGIVVDISRGSMANPILVADIDGFGAEVGDTENTRLSSGARDEAQDQLHQVAMAATAAEPDNFMPDTELSSYKADISLVTELHLDIGEGMNTVESEQTENQRAESPAPALVPVDPTPWDEHGVIIDNYNPSDSSPPVDPITRVSQTRRASSASSLSSSSSSSSSSSIPSSYKENAPSPANSSAGSLESVLAYDKYGSLREIDQKHFGSIVFIRDLARASKVDDVYLYLQLNGLLSSMVCDLQIHTSDSETQRPIASVLFKDCAEAAKALRVLRSSSMPFPPPSEGKLEHVRVQVEPCRPPEWWKEENSLERDAGCSPYVSASASSLRSSEIKITSSNRAVLTSSAEPASSFGQGFKKRYRPLSARSAVNGSVPLNVINRQASTPDECSIQRGSLPETEGQSETNGAGTASPLGRRIRCSVKRIPVASRSISPLGAQQHGVSDVIEVTSGSDADNSIDVSSSSSDSSSESEFESSSVSSDRNTDHDTSETGNVNPRSVEARSAYRIKQLEIQLPTVKHGRARRLLLPPSPASPLISVTMRGDVQFIDQTTRERLVNMSLPAEASEIRRLEDACFANGTAVLGFSKSDNSQASVIAFTDKEMPGAAVFPLEKAPHTQDGILSLAPFKSFTIWGSDSDPDCEVGNIFQFLSGGYDKTIQYWRVSCMLGTKGRPRFSSCVSPLSRGPLNTKISALLHLPGGPRVLAAAGQRLWTLDMEWQAPASFAPSSNCVKQLHVPSKKDPNVFIAEVDHLFSQMHVFDVRKALPGSGRPVLEFGYPDSATDARHVRSQKRRGDSSVMYFARGYHDGTVCMWDYRNVREPVVTDKCTSPITHTIFAGRKTRNLWTFAGDKVRFLEVD